MTIAGVEIEGVGPFRTRRRIQVGPGTVVLLGGNESGKSTLIDLVALLLDPDPQLEIAPFLRSNPPPERSEALLDLRDAEGSFRVHADFDARGLTLQEGDGPILEGPPQAVAEGIRGRLGLPARGHYGRLFVASADALTTSVRGGRLGDARRALEAKTAGQAVRPVRARVEALRAQLAAAREREVQRGLHEAETERRDELEVEAAALCEVREELERVEVDLQRTAALAAAPADLDERVVGYARQAAELSAAEARLRDRGAEIDRERAELEAPSVARRTLLLVGAVVVAGAAALFSLGSLLAPVAFGLGIAALGAAGIAAARVHLAVARLEETRSRETDLTRTLRHRFELETVAVRSLATALALDSPADLPGAIERHRSLVERRDVLRQRAQARDAAELDGELRAVRARLRSVPEPEPVAEERDSAALRVELETAERELRLAERAAQDAAARAASEEIAPAAWQVEGVVRAAAAMHAREAADVWADAEGLAGAYVRALTGRTYAAIRRKGEARWLLEREGREALPLEDATGSATEVLLHAVQFALAERAALVHPLPLLLDDPFVRLDAARRRGAARCVRRLGAVTQVLLATSDPLFGRIADRVVRLDDPTPHPDAPPKA